VQYLIDGLKSTREFLYKLGTKASRRQLETFLTQSPPNKGGASEEVPSTVEEAGPSGLDGPKKWFQKEGGKGRA
jgi:hypothetical protein